MLKRKHVYSLCLILLICFNLLVSDPFSVGTSLLLLVSKGATSVFEKGAMTMLNKISLMGDIPGEKNRLRQTMRRLVYSSAATHILP